MSFRRKCSLCEFVGMEVEFFTKNKKICNKCLIKRIDDSNKKKIDSKLRKKEYLKIWRTNNKDYNKEYLSRWVLENPDKVKEYSKKSYQKGKEKNKKYCREYQKNRRQKDPLFKLVCNLRNLIKNSLTKQGYSKNSKTFEIIGVTYLDFKLYIESKFLEGMCWENYGEWHLDHIIPISSAITEEQAYKLCYYENFQPLWAKDNFSKSNKIEKNNNSVVSICSKDI